MKKIVKPVITIEYDHKKYLRTNVERKRCSGYLTAKQKKNKGNNKKKMYYQI